MSADKPDTLYRGSKDYLFLSFTDADLGQAQHILNELSRRGYRVRFDDRSRENTARNEAVAAAVRACLPGAGAAQAQQLQQELARLGYRVRFDERGGAGTTGDDETANAIKNCSFFIALISGAYLDSASMLDELNYARELNKPILLIYLEEVRLGSGLYMRIGRQQALFKHKYADESYFFDKIDEADGIAGCREAAVQKADAPEAPVPEEPPAEDTAVGEKKRRTPAPLLAAAVLAALCLIFVPRLTGKKAPPPAPTAPVETAAHAAPETPSVTEAPKLTETPTPTPTPTPPPSPQELAWHAAEQLAAEGRTGAAALAFRELGDYKNAAGRSAELWREAGRKSNISTSRKHALGLKEDGTVLAAGDNSKKQCNVSEWTDIVAVSACGSHSLGLRADGTVLATGDNTYGQCKVSDWTDVVAICAGVDYSVGLRADGTVLAAGQNSYGQCNVDKWTDIVAVAAGEYHTLGVRADGTVAATGASGRGQCDVSDWADIVAVAAGKYHSVGLKADGTAVAAGYNAYGNPCDVSGWANVVELAADKHHSLGVRANGACCSKGVSGALDWLVPGWNSVLQIDSSELTVIALRANGTAVTTGEDESIRDGVKTWTGLRTT